MKKAQTAFRWALLVAFVCIVINVSADVPQIRQWLDTSVESPKETPQTLVARLIGEMNRKGVQETVTQYKSDGNVIGSSTNLVPGTQSVGGNLFSADDAKQITIALEKSLPESKFLALPPVRQVELLVEIQKQIRNFPSQVPGQVLSESDRNVKLAGLRLCVKSLSEVPVVKIDKPDLLATQLSQIAELVAESAAQHFGAGLGSDLRFRSQLSEKVGKRFCDVARETSTPNFKRALPDAEYNALIDELKAWLKVDFGPSGKILSEPDEEELRKLKVGEASKFLDEKSETDYLAGVVAGRSLKIVLKAYYTYANSTDLGSVNWDGGVSTNEYNDYIQQLFKLRGKEIEQLNAYREAERKQFWENAKKALPKPEALITDEQRTRIRRSRTVKFALTFAILLNVSIASAFIWRLSRKKP